jgi:tetratricopeptide (TPR) repeat protein
MLELATRIGDRETEAKAHWFLGWAAAVVGDVARTRSEYDAAATLFEQLAQPQSLAATVINLGAHYFELGLLDRAAEYYERGAEHSRQSGSRLVLSYALGNLAEIERLKGDLIKARELAGRALETAVPTGDRRALAAALGTVAAIEIDAGDIDAGLSHVRDAVAHRREIMNNDSLMVDLAWLVRALVASDDRAGALEAAAELEALVKATPNPRHVGTQLYEALANVERRFGDSEKAETYLKAGRALFERQYGALPDDESRAAFAALPYNRAFAQEATAR